MFFSMASILIPVVGSFISLLIPLPFLFYSSKLGLQQGMIIGLISLFIVSMTSTLIGYPHIIIQCIEFGLLGLIISEAFRRKYSFGITILGGILTTICTASVILIAMAAYTGNGPIDLILDYFQNDLNQAIHLYENSGMEQEQITELQQFSQMFVDLFKKIFPSFIIVWTGIVVWINVIISRPLFARKGIRYPNFGSLDRWQAPEFLVWGLIVSGFALFLPVSGIKWAAANALIVMGVIYFFGGLSIVLFLFNKYHIPSWARVGIYILLSIQVVFWLVLALAGLFDQWIDLRKIHYQENETN